MALIKCPDCSKEISDRAEECIGCGRPMTDEPLTGEPLRIPLGGPRLFIPSGLFYLIFGIGFLGAGGVSFFTPSGLISFGIGVFVISYTFKYRFSLHYKVVCAVCGKKGHIRKRDTEFTCKKCSTSYVNNGDHLEEWVW